MLRDLLTFLGRFFQFVVSLIWIALLAAAAWLLWHFYEEEKLQNRFLNEGQVIQVQVADVETSQHSWRDMLGNVSYITFPYQQKNYTARVVFDTAWVRTGDRVRLLYHPQLDEFRQQHVERKPNHVVSRLVKWSSFKDFNTETQLLAGFLVTVAAMFFFVGRLVVWLTGWAFLQTTAQLLLVITLALVTVFFTYDSVQYYRYYQHLKTNGSPQEVTVLKTDRHRIGRSNRRSSIDFYRYDATIRYGNGERVIPITEDEYETLRPRSRLRVLYDASLDDFMSATYPGNYGQLILPLFFLIVFLVVFWNTFLKAKNKAKRFS